MTNERSTTTGVPPQTPAMPFDQQRLDAAMRAAGLDVIVATAPYDVRYLLGGYRHHYYVNDDALALTRYQPIVGYVAGAPQEAFFIGNWMDADPLELHPIWVPDVRAESPDGRASARLLLDALRARGLDGAAIGIEPPFLSLELYGPLGELSGARLLDAMPVLEHLRAVKRPHELQLMRAVSERIVESMEAVYARASVGDSSLDVERWMAAEQRRRGVEFGFSFVAIGADRNRTPSLARLVPGSTLSIDSAGKIDGYIGDLARMGVVGGPSDGQVEALAAVDAVQLAARAPLRAGATGAQLYEAATSAIAETPYGDRLDFIAHGIGVVSHEAPRLALDAPHGYAAAHRDRPLEAGMVVSIETTLADPQLGYVKLEDTVAVTATGCVGLGDAARGWNIINDGERRGTR
ncbi:Xaa-Pro peptidase family protein [Conexibacter sp. CPCC 206217]|uniref:M24 family metallopeptidase n=1 Tax=Conexibacter sp. CPCC 206217 TaxID=3064574 RepID=UPI00272601FB|nr:Xaa-Pro peptidase family protein [Conexibacter sp. CPCC 206217]MDO8210232.1 Xaa-Pro peptidase family protein [Conexibacter sp. CPCC 206217]